jgi:hypothetical protein
MTHTQTIKLALFFLCAVSSFITIASDCKNTWYETPHLVKKTHKNALLVGLCASAAYLLTQWFLSDRDQEFVVNAQKTVESIIAEYQDMLTIIDQHYDITQNNQQIIQEATEQEIYDIALCMWQKNKDHDDIRQSILQSINHLSTLLYTLDAREQKLEEQGYYSATYEGIMHHLRDFIHHIMLLREKLKFLKRFITEHETYFSLFEADAYIRNKYHTALEHVKLHDYHHQHNVLQLIRDWAFSYDATIQSIAQMVKAVQADIMFLKRVIVSTNPDYRHRIHTAKQLVDALTLIKAYLTMDPLYTVETAAHAWNTLQ